MPARHSPPSPRGAHPIHYIPPSEALPSRARIFRRDNRPAARLAGALAILLAARGLTLPHPVAASSPDQRARWSARIAGFRGEDRVHPPRPGSVLFVGGSSIELWKTLNQDFPAIPVLNRGLGGSELRDLVDYTEKIVIPYAPSVIVVYAGDNDVAHGVSPEDLVESLRAFLAKVRGVLPRARIIYVSIKPSPRRWALVDNVREANAALRNYIAGVPNAEFVDVFTPMLGPEGTLRPELYAPDGLHMGPAGYALWRQILEPLVRRSWAAAGRGPDPGSARRNSSPDQPARRSGP